MSRDDLYIVSGKCVVGLTELGAALGLTHCTPALLTSARTTALNRRQEFKTARAGKTQAFVDLRTTRKDAFEFLAQARDHLKPVLGARFNGLWAQIGFENQKLAISTKDAKKVSLLAGFQTYFGANEAHEYPEYNITAGRAEELGGLLTARVQRVSDCKFDTRSKRDAQDAAEAVLDRKVRCIWKELETTLDPMDSRWLKFMDRIPGDPRVPEKVEGVTVTRQADGTIAVDWNEAQRAARYKLFKQIVGVDEEPVLADTFEDSDGALTDIPSGVTVKLQVVATNAQGDAPPSEVVELLAA